MQAPTTSCNRPVEVLNTRSEVRLILEPGDACTHKGAVGVNGCGNDHVLVGLVRHDFEVKVS